MSATPLTWAPGASAERTIAQDADNSYVVVRLSRSAWMITAWDNTRFQPLPRLSGTTTPTRTLARAIAAEYSALGRRLPQPRTRAPGEGDRGDHRRLQPRADSPTGTRRTLASNYLVTEERILVSLSRGSNLPLPAITDLVISCAWTPKPPLDADLSALLLVAGKVRTDDDFVFYNQPASLDGSVEHTGKTMRPDASVLDRVTVDLNALPSAIESIVFVVSLDGPPGSVLNGLGDISARIDGLDGTPVATFDITGLVTETAVVTLELYRRDNRWKVRAIGQGYHDGLGGLARDFGVSVDEAEPEADPAAPDSPAAGAAATLPPAVLSPATPVPTGPPPIDWAHPPVPAGYEI